MRWCGWGVSERGTYRLEEGISGIYIMHWGGGNGQCICIDGVKWMLVVGLEVFGFL